MKPRKELVTHTSVLMKEELRNQAEDDEKKSPIYLRPSTRQMMALTCLCIIIIMGGIHLFTNQPLSKRVPKNSPNVVEPSEKIDLNVNHKVVTDNHPNHKKQKVKAKVNLSGQIVEVSEDGLAFRIDETWYTVHENTIYISDEGEEVSRLFLVGNDVSAYTTNESVGDYIRVDCIYRNTIN